MPRGTLTIAATLCAHPPPLLLPPLEVPASDLIADLGRMLASGDGADVTFAAGGERFRAHSFVLLMRSGALRPQLVGPLASAPPFEFTVPDEILAPVFERVLDFIYLDALDITSHEEAQHLLHAASFYALPRLQRMCEAKLLEGLAVANAAATLELAHVHNALALRSSALRFVAAHAGSVMATDGWGPLWAAHPELVNAVLHTVVHGQQPKSIASAPSRSMQLAQMGAAPQAAEQASQRDENCPTPAE
jgi:speckle-type POZ protein